MIEGSESKRPPRLDVLLWSGFFAGPIAWVADLLISYSLVPTVCESGTRLPLIIVTAVAAIVSLAGAVIARSQSRFVPGGSQNEGSPDASRRRTMAVSGIVLSVAFTIVILAQAVPKVILDVCD